MGVSDCGSNLLTNIEKKKESYNIEDHPALLNGEMKEIFEILNTNIENISDEVERIFLKLYIAYKIDDKNVVCVNPLNSSVKILLNLDFDEIDDPKNICKDVTEVGHWGTGDIEFKINGINDIEYGMYLIKQAFDKIE